MKKLYFDIDNGEVVRPRDITAPAYCVTIDEKNDIYEMYSCFSKYKIENFGYKWRDDCLKSDHFVWTNYLQLMNNLRLYIVHFKYLSEKQNYEEEYKEHYVYLKFWEKASKQ